MSTRFAIGRFAGPIGPFLGLVVGDLMQPLDECSIHDLLGDWPRSFERLATLAETSTPREPLIGLRFLPPLDRPGKMLHSAANYAEHVKEMVAYNVASGVDPAKRFTGDKSKARPYLFLKASSALTGPYDDIEIPSGEHQIDWEAELAVVVGRAGKHISEADALGHVAGYMTTNDTTCRDGLWREDRPNFKTDWLSSKSLDGFAPMGPLFVPAAFVPNPNDLRITLKVNGEIKQDGNTGEMIFSAAEQIEYASRFMTLHPGDIFVTGTVGGVGQASGTFLKAGDLMETEVHGVGKLCNKLVAAK